MNGKTRSENPINAISDRTQNDMRSTSDKPSCLFLVSQTKNKELKTRTRSAVKGSSGLETSQLP
jgi:hypothetical protein